MKHQPTDITTAPPEDAQRDAIHIAVVPMVAKRDLLPGQHVNAHGGTTGNLVGIASPFVDAAEIEKGHRFWCLLYPNTVTNLRHDWSHPEFATAENASPADMSAAAVLERAKAWVKTYAEEHRPYDRDPSINRREVDSYTEFMARVRQGEIFYWGDDLHGLYELAEPDELFKNLSIILGRQVGGADFEYGCSC